MYYNYIFYNDIYPQKQNLPRINCMVHSPFITLGNSNVGTSEGMIAV